MPPSLSSVSKIVSGRMPRFTIASNVALADKMDDRILVGVPFGAGSSSFVCLHPTASSTLVNTMRTPGQAWLRLIC